MKTFYSNRKIAYATTLVLALAGVVAWSPPTSEDIIVSTGSPALVLGPAGNSYTAGTAHRGIIAGGNNVSESYGAYSVVVGSENEVKSGSSIVVGTYNDAALDAISIAESLINSAVFGYANLATKGTDSCLISGKLNSFHAHSSLIAGFDNDLRGATIGNRTYYSAAIGYGNEVFEDSGWAMGLWNKVTGNRGVAIGTGTTSNKAHAVALGKFNSDMVTGDVLVVGTGVDANNKKTSVSVRGDGTVILGNATSGNVLLTKAQGDISMGAYQ